MEKLMRTWIRLLLVVACSGSAATESILNRETVDDVPRGLSAKDAQEWRESNCKWRFVNDDDHVGMGGAGSAQSCFAQARTMMIMVDQDPTIGAASKAAYRNDLIMIYVAPDGHRQVCHAKPVKDPYDGLTFEDYVNDVHTHNGEPSDAFLNRLNDNVELQCLTM